MLVRHSVLTVTGKGKTGDGTGWYGMVWDGMESLTITATATATRRPSR